MATQPKNGKKKTTAMVKVADYKIVTFNPDRRKELIQGNLGDGGLSMFDLEAPKVLKEADPPMFQIGADTVETIDAVIIGHFRGRGLWPDKNNPAPTCVSRDCITGVGDPGGNCGVCPLSKFGSADNGGGQACNLKHHFFVARPDGGILPTLISLPPTSLKAARAYLGQTANSELMYYEVVTRFGLQSAGEGNQKYAKFTLSRAGELSSEEKATFKQIAAELAPLLKQVPVQEAEQDDPPPPGVAEAAYI